MKKVTIWLIIFLSASLVFSQNFTPHILAVMEGEKDGDWFGRVVAGIGDINADGFDDFAIQKGGTVCIYFGSSIIDTIPDWILSYEDPRSKLGYTISKVGDFNGDKIDDFIIGTPRANFDKGAVFLYLGDRNINFNNKVRFSAEGDLFGGTLSYGNFNGDHYSDLLISANHQGRIYLFSGNSQIDTVADAVFYEGGGFLLILPSSKGDMNNDGYDDLIIGSNFGTFFYFGGNPIDTQADYVFYPDYSTFGDFNGDHISDIMITRKGILFGSCEFDTTVDVSLKIMGPVCSGFFNQDTYADFIVGDGSDYGGLGAVYLYLGGDSMDNQYDWAGRGTGGGQLGYSIANAGDVNGDGVEDFLVSEPGYYFGKNRGRVFLLSGDTTHLAGIAGNFPHVPKEIILHQNYPNPFNSTTAIRYEINRSALVQITIINLLGKEVKTLVQKQHSPGAYQIEWDGKDNFGNEVTGGVYFIILKTGGFKQSKKLIIMQ